VLFLVNVLNFYDRQALGAVLEPLRKAFTLSDTQLGALATAFTLVYAVAGVPFGRLSDRGNRKPLLAFGVTVWAGLTAAGALAASYAALLVSRIGVGIGEAVCGPAATSWIADLVPPERRARAMARFMMAVPVGGMLSFAVTGPVAQAWGWRAALAVAALPAVVLVPALLALREPEREKAPAVRERRGSASLSSAAGRTGRSGADVDVRPTSSAWALVRIGGFGWIAVSGAVVNFALYSFSTFLPAFLTRVHGLTVGRAGIWTGLGSGAAGIAGALAAGALGERDAAGRLRLAALAALAAAPAGFAGIAAGGDVAAVALLMLAYGLLQMYYGLVYAAIHDIAPPQLRGTAIAVYLTITYLCGAAFGPLLTGGLSDRLARAAAAAGLPGEAARAAGLHQAMYVIPVFSLVLAAVLWAGSRAVLPERRPESAVRP
jgi:MFS family permease